MGFRRKPVEFSNRAVRDLIKFKKFCLDLYGPELTTSILDKIFEKLNSLESQDVDTTKRGAIDEAFSHLKYVYRKIVVKHCKITYRIGKSKIYVIRVFDTRQNPDKNK